MRTNRDLMRTNLNLTPSTADSSPARLIPPYGGRLVTLRVEDHLIPQLTADARRLPSIWLSKRSVCDLELLATGAFSPLDRFMCRADHERVLEEMRLANGSVFPISVTLPVHELPVGLDQDVALRDERNQLLAIMTVTEIYEWEQSREAELIAGTKDPRHPLVAEMCSWGGLKISGPLRLLNLPRHHDFVELRLTPAETRKKLARLRYQNVVAFQTRNPLHRAHEELTKRATEQLDGALLLHPVVGVTNSGDIDSYTRETCSIGPRSMTSACMISVTLLHHGPRSTAAIFTSLAKIRCHSNIKTERTPAWRGSISPGPTARRGSWK
jgi:sulfate adenylyltransferase